MPDSMCSGSALLTGRQFQGGGYQPWGGAGFDMCAELLNHEFQRVLFKNNYAAGIAIFNVYMVSGDR